MRVYLRPAAILFALLTLTTGLLYPMAVTGLAQAFFPYQANGSLLRQGNRVAGSALIGQPFDDPRYFWGRLSATTPFPYNAAASTGSNLGPSNPALDSAVKARVDALRAADPGNTQPVPVDLVTASASGLIPTSALQPRFTRRRGLPGHGAWRRRPFRRSYSSTSRAASSGSWVSRG